MMRRASIHDLSYIAAHAMAASDWYYPLAKATNEKVRDVLRDCLSGGKHYCAVGDGVIVAHVTPNPFGEKQMVTLLLWVGSPWLIRAMLKWAKGRPGIRGVHAPIDPPERVAALLVRLGFERGPGGYFWWR